MGSRRESACCASSTHFCGTGTPCPAHILSPFISYIKFFFCEYCSVDCGSAPPRKALQSPGCLRTVHSLGPPRQHRTLSCSELRPKRQTQEVQYCSLSLVADQCVIHWPMRTKATPWLRQQRIRGSINSRDQPQPCIMHKRSFANTNVFPDPSNVSRPIRRGASSLAPGYGSVFVIQQQTLGSRGGAGEMHSAVRSRTHAADAGMTHAGYY